MKKVIVLLAVMVMMIAITACNKSNSETQGLDKNITYSQNYGEVSGVVDLSTEMPNISISNIKSYVGEEIDYSAGISIENADESKEFQMWVDASEVDIYEVGDYKATYKFVYSGNEIEKTIYVSIVQREDEKSGDSVANNENQNGNNNSSNNGNGSGNNNQNDNQSTTAGGNTATAGGNTATPSQTSNPSIDSTTGQTAKQGTTTKTSNQSSTKVENNTTKRQMITGTNVVSMVQKDLGYMNIELLNGNYIQIKCTTSRYIASTRTDTTVVTRNGIDYQVSKLIITYNTGEERVLETSEVKK